MTDALTAIINSPATVWGGQLVAGATLFGSVWGFFKGVESVLTDDTKLEIAVWLLGARLGETVEPWPDTFAMVFDRVFGTKHLSWKCFWRSCLASFGGALLAWSLLGAVYPRSWFYLTFLRKTPTLKLGLSIVVSTALGNALPDYISLLESRLCLRLMQRTRAAIVSMTLLAADLAFTTVIATFATVALSTYVLMFGDYIVFGRPISDLAEAMRAAFVLPFFAVRQALIDPSWFADSMKSILDKQYSPMSLVWFFPAFFTSIWLWLYAASGFILKFAHRFDRFFQWFNSKADIEHKPLSAIGLVAGALVALVYWVAVVVGRWVA
jgi:hypothetical protein